MPKIEFLFWRECPSHPQAWDRLHQIMREMDIAEDVQRIEVRTQDEAVRQSFIGSPTIRINGIDIDRGGAQDEPCGLTCRIYHDASGRSSPFPPDPLIRNALSKELKKGGSHGT